MSSRTSLQAFSQASSQQLFPLAVFVFRVVFGMLFVLSAFSKFSVGGWSASMYLAHASGPFELWFQSLAGNSLRPIEGGLLLKLSIWILLWS